MRRLFYLSVISLILFEIARVYLIMPMPGSQKTNAIDIAYFLQTYRWAFRAALGFCIILSATKTFRSQRRLGRIVSILCLLFLGAVIYMFNFKMVADKMFYQPHTLSMVSPEQNTIPAEKLVLGYACDGEARAYPIQLIAYHHQVLDTVCNEPVMVTYCSVCRSGRIFKPEIDGQSVSFRLVGMDQFNAMFEDNHTKSWWRQATGEAVSGKHKGKQLPELFAEQMTLSQWLSHYPNSKIMQYDTVFQEQYDSLDTYDIGVGRGKLTGTDTLSWNDKSWVIGVDNGNVAKAYDWNLLKERRVIHDLVDREPILLVMAKDDQNFAVFSRSSADAMFTVQNDTLYSGQSVYEFSGKAVRPGDPSLKKMHAYQEFWHSWRTFHPGTLRYNTN